MTERRLRILGTRGIPAAHGGFETFAERLALFLVDRGWSVTVYCQATGADRWVYDDWRDVHRVHVPAGFEGPAATVVFDWRSMRHASRYPDLCLTLGYNTAVFCAWLRLKGRVNVINMDGIEWQRAKWGPAAKAWLWLNERAASRLGNHLIADHPEITRHLGPGAQDHISMIPYGADRLDGVPDAPILDLGLVPSRYLTLIARPEPENSVLEVVSAFSRRPRGVELAVLGAYDEANDYHSAVRRAAGPEVRFLGAIYDVPTVQALRFHCLAYVHGHQVGGTNPSLVEALGAGNAVIAHDNRFNRWVAGHGAQYFMDADGFADVLDVLLHDEAGLQSMRRASLARFDDAFAWASVLQDYETLLLAQAAD